MDPLAVEEMLPYLTEHFGNASSLHHLGAESARALRASRQTFADALGCDPAEIVFTSGGTEADNLGVRGAAQSARKDRRHALIFDLEHPAVRNQTDFLEAMGFTVETIPTKRDGVLDVDALEGMLRPKETALVCVMHANNEIGTIQPLGDIAELLEDVCPDAHLHVDAVQSFTKLDVRPQSLGATTLALAGHKIHGPKGVGALYVKRGSRLRSQVAGGGQERGVRSGTENVAGIVGFAAATRLAMANREKDVARMTALRDHLLERILREIPDVDVNGSATRRLCNNINVNIAGARAEVMLHGMEERGVLVSSGSACHAGQTGPSHVLKAIGLTEKDTGSLRITLSRHTTQADVDACASALNAVVPGARKAGQ